MPNHTKLLAALGAALSLAAAAMGSDLPVWLRVAAVLPALVLTGVFGWRAWARRRTRLTAPRGPLAKVKQAEERGKRR